MGIQSFAELGYYTSTSLNEAAPSVTIPAAPSGHSIFIRLITYQTDNSLQSVTIKNASGTTLRTPITTPVTANSSGAYPAGGDGFRMAPDVGTVFVAIETPTSAGYLTVDWTFMPQADALAHA